MKIQILIIIAFFSMAITSSYGQCEGYDKYPDGEKAALKLFETYQQQIIDRDFVGAFENWKRVYDHSPAGNVAHYTDGVYLYKQLMRKATESSTIVMYQSELLRLYDRRMKCFGYPSETENIVLGEKAVEMYHINYDESVTMRTFKYVLETGELRHSPSFVEIYGAYSTYLYGGEKIDLFHLWQSRQQLESIIQYNLKNTDDFFLIDAYSKAKENIDVFYDLYLSDADTCSENVKILKNRYLTTTSDSIRNKTYEYLQTLNCIEAFRTIEELRKMPIGSIEDSEVGKELKQLELAASLSSKTAQKAAMAYDKKQYLLAAELYEQASTETGNNIDKSRYAYRIAEIYFNKINNKQDARSFAYQAMNLDPSWGLPYLLIGNMYEASYNECVKEAGIDSKLMVKAAINKWQMAKELDASTIKAVDEKLEKYEKLVKFELECPNPIFKTFVLDCWINEEVIIQECKE